MEIIREKIINNNINNESFRERDGYILEKFSSKAEMYHFMQKIRKSSPNEANGFVVEKSSQHGFYYQIGDNKIMTQLSPNIGISWHSHPDGNIPETVFREEDLPSDTSEEIKRAAKTFVQTYGETDEASPEKISLLDIIDIVSNRRKKDLISLPGGLLELDFLKSEEKSLIRVYGSELHSQWTGLVEEIIPQLTLKNFPELRINMVFRYYDFAISKFKKMINGAGYEKMDKHNSLEILEKIGLKHEFKKI